MNTTIKKSTLLLLFFSVIGFSAIGQDNQIGYSDGYYYYQSVRYKIQELGGILNADKTSTYYYSEGMKRYKEARRDGLIGATGVGVGIFSFLLVKKMPETPYVESLQTMPNALFAIMGIAFGSTGVIFSLSAINNKTASTKLMKKAVAAFNKRQAGMGSSLQLELKGNGIGLCLRF